MSLFCLRLPRETPHLGGLYLMKSSSDGIITCDSLKDIKEQYFNFYGFEIIEIDNENDRNILNHHGSISEQKVYYDY